MLALLNSLYLLTLIPTSLRPQLQLPQSAAPTATPPANQSADPAT